MIRINLLPVEERAARTEAGPPLWMVAVGGAALLTALVVGGVYLLQTRALASLASEEKRLEELSAQYRPLIERVNRLSAERKELETKMAVIDELDQERSYRVRLLEELNANMPRYAWLTKFLETGGTSAEIEGSTFTNLVVADLISALERSALYDQVDLTVAKKAEIGDVDVVEFKLTAALTKPAPEEIKVSSRAGASPQGSQ